MKIEMISNKVLSDHWAVLRQYTYDLTRHNGGTVRQMREVYDRGNGATLLLYSVEKKTVVLIRQFRIPTYLNGNRDGLLIETIAGLLDNDAPEDCVRREAMEETGFEVGQVTKVFEAYMSPGGVTEIIHFFAAPYTNSQKVAAGGGIEDEDIEILELPFQQALEMIKSGEIKDGKTIMLLQYAQIQGWMNLSAYGLA